MPTDKKISQLASGAPAQGTDETVIARGGANYKLTAANIATYVASTITVFPSGTAMLFAQTTAPTGWTKSTTHNDKALRVVSGTASSGGSVAFSSAFISQAVSGSIGSTTATNQATTATNQNTTATNQNTTATNQSTTATNQATTATNLAATATNQATTATNIATTQGGTVGTSVSGSVSGSVGNTTLGINEIASHAHTLSYGTSVPVPNGNFHNVLANTGNISTNANGGSGAHGHSWSGSWSGSASSSLSGDSHNHTQNAHNHTQDAHNHTQNSHNHTQDAHSHTQDAHTHTQNAHTHTQDAHNHTQDAHNHSFTGTAINLAVAYVDVIIATKD